MKVVAFSGSARKDGNTALLIGHVFTELEVAGIETELFQLSGKKIHGCIACYQCFANKDKHCAVQNDVLNECLDKMLEADGIILGSPTYFADVSTEIKALIDQIHRWQGQVLLVTEGGYALVARLDDSYREAAEKVEAG